MNNLDPLEVRFPAGSVLFREGESGNTGYYIESGRVRVWIKRDGGEVTLCELKEGELVGELSAIDLSPRSASATALTDCVLVKFNHHQILNRINMMDPVMQRLVHTLVERIRSTNSQITTAFGTGSNPNYLVNLPEEGPKSSLGNLKRESELRRAIERKELQLFFQPIVNLKSLKLSGFEGLIRWQHPENGLIGPDQFIPLAEECGMISDITQCVLSSMFSLAGEFQLAALKNIENVDQIFLTANVSARDIVDPAFAGKVIEQVGKAQCSPSLFKLEVTESCLIDNPQMAAETLDKISDVGIGIAIDDFGTGHSNLSSLISHPMSTLKIDRSFITAKLDEGNNSKIVSMILKLAVELGADVVAEGIETGRDMEILRQLNCPFGQGYLFSKAMPLTEALAFVQNWKADLANITNSGQPIARYA